MSSRIRATLAREVRERAGNICEYCLLPQDSQEATFHIDHVVPRSRGGPTILDNLALACVTCSLRKAARHRVRDPHTGRSVPLFNPRTDTWSRHFSFTKGGRIVGLTSTGRATVRSLGMNRAAIVPLRRELLKLGRFPPRFE
jgi:5-methylcytosine-specific restriction endonuclease McrA